MINYLGSPNGLITANQIADGSILGADITSNTISNTKLVDLTVTGDKVASNTIGNLKIADTAAIVYSKLTLANSILNADINTAAGIVNTKLASGTLTNTEINASAAIVGSKLADASIANTKLIAATLTNTEISGTAAINPTKLSGYGANFLATISVASPQVEVQLNTLTVTNIGGGGGSAGAGGFTAASNGFYAFSFSLNSPQGATGFGYNSILRYRVDGASALYTLTHAIVGTTTRITLSGTVWLFTGGQVLIYMVNSTSVAMTVNVEGFVRLTSV